MTSNSQEFLINITNQMRGHYASSFYTKMEMTSKQVNKFHTRNKEYTPTPKSSLTYFTHTQP